MCIIAAKPAGVPMPSRDIIDNMWYNNPDGAGIMWADKRKVHIRKGFMTHSALIEFLDKLKEDGVDLDSVPVVLHFRITTHGGTKPENCHPFPVSSQVGQLKKLFNSTDVAVAHNGIIHIEPRNNTISDTMEYIMSQMAPLKQVCRAFYNNKYCLKLIENAIDSKMAILAADGTLVTIGTFTEDGGIRYSNGTYDWEPIYARRRASWSAIFAMELPEDGYVLPFDREFEPGVLSGEDVYMDIRNNVYTYNWDIDCAFKVCKGTMYDKDGNEVIYDPIKSQMLYIYADDDDDDDDTGYLNGYSDDEIVLTEENKNDGEVR
jgi:hypothetical protein